MTDLIDDLYYQKRVAGWAGLALLIVRILVTIFIGFSMVYLFLR